MWHYIGRQRSLPGTPYKSYMGVHALSVYAVQWTAWLSHTRAEPPSLQELQRDIFRRQRLMQNVAQIEARDAEEAARIAEARRMDMLAAPSSAQSQAHAPTSIQDPAVTATVVVPGTTASAHNPGALPYAGSTVENVHAPPNVAVDARTSTETREPEKIVQNQSDAPKTPDSVYPPNKDRRADLPKVAKDEKWQPESWAPRSNVRRGG